MTLERKLVFSPQATVPERMITTLSPMTVVIVITLISLCTIAIYLFSYGDLSAGAGFLMLLLVLAVTCYRLDYGFYAFIGAVLLFDQFEVPGFQPFTGMINYFTNLNANPLIPSNGIVVSPMELHLFFLITILILLAALRKNISVFSGFFGFELGMLACTIIGSIVYGQLRGGDIIASLWESRAFLYFGVLYLVVPQIIRTKSQLINLIWICIVVLSFKAFQGIARFIELGFTFGEFRTLTNHEDPVFFISLFMLLTGWIVFSVRHTQRTALLWMLIPLVMGYFVALRRATYASLAVSSLAYVILLPKHQRKIVQRWLLVLIVIFGLYLGLFWNSENTVGIVAQQFKLILFNDPTKAGNTGSSDYSSTLYRKWEDYNLSQTFRHAPIFGIGFGMKYDMPLAFWGLSAVSYLIYYIPHNQILWLAVKMGSFGYFWFWFFCNSFILKGTTIFYRLRDPYLKSVCAVCILALINQCIVSYFDMQLSWYRNMIYLGMWVGMLTSLERIDQNAAPPERLSVEGLHGSSL